jgi:8-oxo-dGTP pyrophosphatase MutT (NUDIX family)
MTSIEKVTAFVTAHTSKGTELLLFRHPNAGIQIPAGTVNPGETPDQAVIREVAEETGLVEIEISRYLSARLEQLPENSRVILKNTRVYAHPDKSSFDWAHLRPGITVAVLRRAVGFTQICYQEFNQVPDPQYVSMSIQGWVPDEALTQSRRRHFYHLEFNGKSTKEWQVFADHHRLTLFWSPLHDLPDIIPPQDEWLTVLKGWIDFNSGCKIG